MKYLRPAKFNTMHLVDMFLLEVELSARRIRCEVPNCSSQAVTVYGDEMPAFVCLAHADLCKKGLGYGVKTLIAAHLRRIVLEAANRAWAESESEVVFTYDPSVALDRYINAPEVVPPASTPLVYAWTPPARPALPTLPSVNTEVPLMEFFPL